MIKKIVNYITFISLGIFGLLIFILLLDQITDLPYEIRSSFIHFLYYKFTPAFLFLGSIGFIIKSIMAKSKPWTKWLSIGIFAFFTFTLGIRFILFGGSINKDERMVVYILTIICVVCIVSILFVKKYTITRWISFGLWIIITFFSGIMTIAVITQGGAPSLYQDDYVIYQSLENKKFKVVHQTGKYGQTRIQMIKNSKMPIRHSEYFMPEELNGRWSGYDEFGNLVSINTYKDGQITAREPVVPENAELIGNIDSLLLTLNNPTQDRYICLEGNFFLERPFKIKGAKNITITKPLNVSNPIINSNYDGHNALVFENCENIILDSLNLNLSSNYNKEPGIINIINCSNIMIRNSDITGKAKYAIYIDNNSSGIIIKNNTISGYSSDGIYLSAENTTISENSFSRLDKEDYYTDIKIPSGKLSQKDITQLIRTSLENTDDYPFAKTEQVVKIGDNWLTIFLGGPSDLYYYAGIYEALNSYYSNKYGSDMGCRYNYCYNILYKISGVQPFITDVSKIKDKWAIYEGEPKFGIVNPDFIDWMRNNFLISPETKVASVKLQELYDEVFFHFFRMLTESYLYFHQNYNLDDEISYYKGNASDYNLTNALYQKYNGILPEYDTEGYNQYEEGDYIEEEGESYEGEGEYQEGYEGEQYEGGEYEGDSYEGEGEYYGDEGEGDYYEGDYYYNNTPFFMKQYECVGFWLRREIDGSADKLFKLLADFVKIYDSQWFNELSIKYGYSE
ncbi:MAG: right-handed parallel beta-helix repeat-containing protein [Bacteroidales bacterium]|nr:right-handed parallel beta-helix repeat-containing protein [Bacteroidales bacterium]